MRNKIVVLLALLAVTGFAAASALTVKHRQETASLHAERFSVGELFVIEASSPSPVITDAGASGVPGSPVEMTVGTASARTALVRDHWQYVVKVREATAAAVTSGRFTIELQVDGATLASLHVAQATSDPAAIEGVEAVFDLGATIQSSSLYYVVVKSYAPPGESVSYTMRSGLDEADAYAWLGAGDPIEPTITVAVNTALSLTAKNADAASDLAPHNIGIKSGATLLSPPGYSGVVDAVGEEATITWTPTAAGTYTYVCQYHSTMAGTITVTA